MAAERHDAESGPFHGAMVLTGPTASGKSARAVALAKQMDAEIISMDSMALYRGMDIGTAKPNAADRRRVPHHLVDVLDPWESASVSWWLTEAAKVMRQIKSRGKEVLFVGGTPLYLKSMMFGLFDGPPEDEAIRRHWRKRAKQDGADEIFRELERVDPKSAQRLHPNDVRRVVRALEVWQLTGKPLSQWQQQWRGNLPRARLRCVWLNPPRASLYERINERVESMFDAGLIAEVETLLRLPQPLSRQARQALGYKEVLKYLQQESSLPATIDLIQKRTRNFAKRQITWFRSLPNCLPIADELTIAELRERMESEDR